MKRKSFLVLFVGLVACTNSTNNLTEESKKNIQEDSSLKANLIGKWGGFKESEPVWSFTMDSIYYFQEKKNYKYILKGDVITVFYKAGPFTLKNVNIKADTLFFTDEIGIVKSFRFK